ncbi:ABC transporter ATP-binding protein [Vagococcus silagei]|uniref:Multidrug resistance ABC transporter ATP-binding and permease protein n=1 Tax=Vagococcus silagei TaxID=2508885 RepID=A0A4S3B3W9_9ENTE|nr:ABC transporter ATP-binding protein [Vagococcus silagei]THB61771.1 ABC transporter ATP-binding protein [Vagococcus silagei]
MKNNNKTLFKRFLKPYTGKVIAASSFGAFSGILTAVITLFIGKTVDTMVQKNQVDFPKMFQLLLFLSLIVTIHALTQWGIQKLGNTIAYRFTRDIREEAFQHLNKLSANFYDTNRHGDIISRFTNDLELVSVAFTTVFNQLFSGLAMIIVSLISMLLLNFKLTLIILVSTLLMAWTNYIVANKSQSSFRQQQRQLGKMNGFLAETIQNQKLVTLLQQEEATIETFETLNAELHETGKKAQFLSSLTNPLSRFVDHIGYLAIGLVGGLIMIHQPEAMTVGMISSFILYAAQFSKPIIELSSAFTQILAGVAGLNRIQFILEQTPEEVQDEQTTLPAPKNGFIQFEDVSFAYEENHPILKNLNFDIQPGETVAIVGPTGAGKSTIVNLIMRYYDVTNGTILVDEEPLARYQLNDFRKNFGLVLQEPWLFQATLWDNLTFGADHATEELVRTACEEVGMMDFIDRLPDGFNTQVDEHTLALSSGQKQLFTIARVIINQPRFLIFDEATSSIDTVTDAIVQKSLQRLMQKRTSIVIAHRLGTILNADKIIVLKDGEVAQIGTHAMLMDQTDGLYYNMFQSQFQS